MLPAQYFRRHEFACRCGCGFDTVDAELLDVLIELRHVTAGPIKVISGCRCLPYNERIQKEVDPNYVPYSSNSQHMLGRAVDIQSIVWSADEVWRYLVRVYKNQYGIGKYNTFTHIDTRSGSPARW